MDFKSLKEKALELQKKANQKFDEAVDYSAKKLSESKLTISTKEDLEKIIEKSKTTHFKNKETGEEKDFKHKSIVIFGDEKSDFFKDALVSLPVLSAKAFSQNISLKLAKSNIENIKLEDYKVKNLPSLVVFEEEKVYKVIETKENIQKLVKSFDLDINKQIEEL